MLRSSLYPDYGFGTIRNCHPEQPIVRYALVWRILKYRMRQPWAAISVFREIIHLVKSKEKIEKPQPCLWLKSSVPNSSVCVCLVA